MTKKKRDAAQLCIRGRGTAGWGSRTDFVADGGKPVGQDQCWHSHSYTTTTTPSLIVQKIDNIQ